MEIKNSKIIDMLTHIKSKLDAKNLKSRREKSTWRKGIRKLLLLKPSSSKSNKMKWTLSRRNSRQTSMRDSSSEKTNTISYFKDTKMWRRKLKINKTLRESSSREHSKVLRAVVPDLQQQPREAWCNPRWVSPEWRDPRWEEWEAQPEIQHPSHPIWTSEDQGSQWEDGEITDLIHMNFNDTPTHYVSSNF